MSSSPGPALVHGAAGAQGGAIVRPALAELPITLTPFAARTRAPDWQARASPAGAA